MVCTFISDEFRLYICFLPLTNQCKIGGGASGTKFRLTLGLPVGAVINCADNSGAKSIYMIGRMKFGSHLNRLPSACVGDMIIASVKKGKPELRKKSELRSWIMGSWSEKRYIRDLTYSYDIIN